MHGEPKQECEYYCSKAESKGDLYQVWGRSCVPACLDRCEEQCKDPASCASACQEQCSATSTCTKDKDCKKTPECDKCIPGLPRNYMLSRWSIKTQEVLVQDAIPPEAIRLLP